MLRLIGGLVLGAAVCSLGCVEAPEVGAAAAPSQAKSRGPVMGSATSNEEVVKKIAVINQLLDGKIDVSKAVGILDAEYKDLDQKEKDKRLASVKEAFNSIQAAGKVADGPERKMILARVYFAEHRFIEAAMLLTEVLDVRDDHPGARNLLARCFYFLGNRDRTIRELEFLLKHPRQSRVPGERIDALFLLGAAVAEADTPTKEMLAKGMWAWETHLKEFPESERTPQVQEGLARMREKASGAATSSAGAPPPGGRVAALGADASEFDKARAAGLDALDQKNLVEAEKQLLKAMGMKKEDPAVLVGMGRVFVQTGRANEAKQAFGFAKKLDPNYMPAWHYGGMAEMLGGNGAGAADNWQYILDKDPNYAKRFKLDQRINVARRMGGG